MEREIKFRAWVETDDGVKMVYLENGEMDNGIWFQAPEHIDKYLSIMQYTGLKDKNGKEIYEGDVVELYNEYFQVRQAEDGAWVGDNSDFKHGILSHHELGRSEIFGTIYENPELLTN